MRRHGRVVRWGKWAATVCALFMLVVWAGSAKQYILIGPINRTFIFAVSRGRFVSARTDSPLLAGDSPTLYLVGPPLPRDPFHWWPILSVKRSAVGQAVEVALWPIVLAFSVVAVWLWTMDRRHAPGHCLACGYDLTGNESGVCPECGTATQRRGR